MEKSSAPFAKAAARCLRQVWPLSIRPTPEYYTLYPPQNFARRCPPRVRRGWDGCPRGRDGVEAWFLLLDLCLGSCFALLVSAPSFSLSLGVSVAAASRSRRCEWHLHWSDCGQAADWRKGQILNGSITFLLPSCFLILSGFRSRPPCSPIRFRGAAHCSESGRAVSPIWSQHPFSSFLRSPIWNEAAARDRTETCLVRQKRRVQSLFTSAGAVRPFQ